MIWTADSIMKINSEKTSLKSLNSCRLEIQSDLGDIFFFTFGITIELT